MKRAKIMLLTIAVFATVGTALAFKVNKFGQTTYCYLTTNVQPDLGQCTDESDAAAVIPGVGMFYKRKPASGCRSAICEEQGSGFDL